jgi:hypothetical protein
MSNEKGCCDEPQCTRKQPVGLYLADLSGTVYAVTRWRADGTLPDGRERRKAAVRHDVTAQMEQFVRANPEWVRNLLPENGAGTREESLTEEILRNAGDDIEPGETPQDLAIGYVRELETSNAEYVEAITRILTVFGDDEQMTEALLSGEPETAEGAALAAIREIGRRVLEGRGVAGFTIPEGRAAALRLPLGATVVIAANGIIAEKMRDGMRRAFAADGLSVVFVENAEAIAAIPPAPPEASTMRRLHAAEQVCLMFGWTGSPGNSDRDKALFQLWREWVDLSGVSLDPAEHPELSDERITELAGKRDQIRTGVLAKLRGETETESST